ncbi:hypothetical protein IMZ48_18430, partial [Candidatus Bathyarchaeota archaeon]|nr:hypothetical protein [Candidatus Bathyarchaeota archaeon]
MKRSKSTLVNFLTCRIKEILDDEILDGCFEVNNDTGDIEITDENPRILSWGAFLQLSKEELDEYEPYRYPDSFQRFASKAVWLGLRTLDTPEWLNIKGILQREGDFDWSFNAFREIVGCEVSHNLNADVLYLGSDDRTLINKAVRRLDLLFEYRVSTTAVHWAGYLLTGSISFKEEASSVTPDAAYPPASGLIRMEALSSSHFKVPLGRKYHHPDQR